MPIRPSIEATRISQEEFGAIAYEVTRHVLAIHREFGCFFQEVVYKRELQARLDGVALEVPVDLIHDTFATRVFADVLVHGSALFEFKVVDSIHPRHRSQTIRYLLLFGLAHAKLYNMHGEAVEHEFINCLSPLSERRNPDIESGSFAANAPGASTFRDLLALISDWGTGLQMPLYEAALIHLLGGPDRVLAEVPIMGTKGLVAEQRMTLAAPNAAFCLTALPARNEAHAANYRRMLAHTTLECMHWANIHNNKVTFTTLRS